MRVLIRIGQLKARTYEEAPLVKGRGRDALEPGVA